MNFDGSPKVSLAKVPSLVFCGAGIDARGTFCIAKAARERFRAAIENANEADYNFVSRLEHNEELKVISSKPVSFSFNKSENWELLAYNGVLFDFQFT